MEYKYILIKLDKKEHEEAIRIKGVREWKDVLLNRKKKIVYEKMSDETKGGGRVR